MEWYENSTMLLLLLHTKEFRPSLFSVHPIFAVTAAASAAPATLRRWTCCCSAVFLHRVERMVRWRRS